MPTFILKQNTTATLPNRPVAVRAMTSPKEDSLRMAVVMEDGSALPASAVRTPNPGLMILPRVPGGVRLEVYRADGVPFEAGTSLVMSIASEGNDLDPVRVELRTEVSGLEVASVAAMTPGEHGVVVSLLQDDTKPLPGWAGMAASATRSLLGAHRPADAQTRDLAVLVDASASMTPWVEDGSLAVLLSVLAGIDHVCGRRTKLDVRLSAASSTWTDAEASTVGETFATQMATLPPQSGFRSRAHRPPTERSLVIVSDAVPLDWQPGDAVVVVLARGQAAGLTVRDVHQDVHVLNLPDGVSAEEYLADRSVLHTVVAGILRALHVEPSPRRNP